MLSPSNSRAVTKAEQEREWQEEGDWLIWSSSSPVDTAFPVKSDGSLWHWSYAQLESLIVVDYEEIPCTSHPTLSWPCSEPEQLAFSLPLVIQQMPALGTEEKQHTLDSTNWNSHLFWVTTNICKVQIVPVLEGNRSQYPGNDNSPLLDYEKEKSVPRQLCPVVKIHQLLTAQVTFPKSESTLSSCTVLPCYLNKHYQVWRTRFLYPPR